jgi:hypothetical protein
VQHLLLCTDRQIIFLGKHFGNYSDQQVLQRFHFLRSFQETSFMEASAAAELLQELYAKVGDGMKG